MPDIDYRTVLLVDDNPKLAPLVTKLLEILGFENVEFCDDVATARELVESLPIVLVVCDLDMPTEDGISFLRWIRAHPEPAVRAIPFILTEEHFTFEDISVADGLGADGILLKPYDAELFRTKIRHAVCGVARRRRKANGDLALEPSMTFAQSLFAHHQHMEVRSPGKPG